MADEGYQQLAKVVYGLNGQVEAMNSHLSKIQDNTADILVAMGATKNEQENLSKRQDKQSKRISRDEILGGGAILCVAIVVFLIASPEARADILSLVVQIKS